MFFEPAVVVGFKSRCYAYNSQSQVIPSDEYTLLEFDSVLYDNLDEFDLDNNRYVIQKPGYYHIEVVIRAEKDSHINPFQLAGYKNGDWFAFDMKMSREDEYPTLRCSIDYYFEAGDYITFKIIHTVGTDYSLEEGPTYSYFTIHRFA